MTYIILIGILVTIISIYSIAYIVLKSPLQSNEQEIVELFLKKVSKIPALIEVMRPHVYEERAFDLITSLHSHAMIHDYDGIYDLLEHNARIHDQFLFLMKLSVHIPPIQKNAYFLYIRDFIINYDRDMQSHFSSFNSAVRRWNRFVWVKNLTGIGLLFPGSTMAQV